MDWQAGRLYSCVLLLTYCFGLIGPNRVWRICIRPVTTRSKRISRAGSNAPQAIDNDLQLLCGKLAAQRACVKKLPIYCGGKDHAV